MTSVLFLDVDGVLNSRKTMKPGVYAPLCRYAIRRLQHVVSVTGCNVVLSSTWRKSNRYVEALKASGGFPNPHEDWKTGEMGHITTDAGITVSAAMRGHEIAEWLSRHPEVERYAIVDDDSDMLEEPKALLCPNVF